MRKYNIDKRSILLSIVVPVYNVEKYILNTLKSLEYITRKLKSEIIIQNNLSTDKTTLIIDKYIKKRNLRNFHHYCEKDSGQSNAINKGVLKAKGQWVTWLCGDDILRKEFLELFKNGEIENYDVIYGDVVFFNGKDFFPAIGTEDYTKGKLLTKRLFIQQPGTIIRKSYWDVLGGVDEKLNFHMDYELFIRLDINNARFKRVKSFISMALLRNDAKTSSPSINRLREYYCMYSKYHMRNLSYFSIKPYLIYTLEFILKNIEHKLYKSKKVQYILIHKYLTSLFWALAKPVERTDIESRFLTIKT